MNEGPAREYGNGAVQEWELRLYVIDWTPRCVLAYKNLKRICTEHLQDRFRIEVVDLLEHPEVAKHDQIVAIPTLVKAAPKPERTLVGDFSQVERVLKWLDIEPANSRA